MPASPASGRAMICVECLKPILGYQVFVAHMAHERTTCHHLACFEAKKESPPRARILKRRTTEKLP